MKKKVLTGLTVLLAVFISCEHEVTVPEETDYCFLQNNCTEYFFNLTENYPLNSIGTCGYVAACSLFSYYNYYFDDAIVDEKYECGSFKTESDYEYTSPGLKKIQYADVKNLSNIDYYNYLKQNTENYLQACLIVSANEHFLTADKRPVLFNVSSKSPGALFDGYSSRFSDHDCEIQVIMEYYLYNLMNFDRNYIQVNRIIQTEASNNVRTQIVKKLKEGVPVLVSAKEIVNSQNNHMCIIYDYDETEDEMYGNVLMMDNYRHLKMSSLYKTIKYPLFISICEN